MEIESTLNASTTGDTALSSLLDGWNGYHQSIVRAISPLTSAQLQWRPFEGRRSVGELARHIAVGRVQWFSRMDAPLSAGMAASIDSWFTDGDGNRHIVEQDVVGADDAAELAVWLERSWEVVAATLDQWHPSDLAQTYYYKFRGVEYDNSRQWTLFRILAHDIHHGGQLSLMLDMQGISAFELIDLGGHIAEPRRHKPE